MSNLVMVRNYSVVQRCGYIQHLLLYSVNIPLPPSLPSSLPLSLPLSLSPSLSPFLPPGLYT